MSRLTEKVVCRLNPSPRKSLSRVATTWWCCVRESTFMYSSGRLSRKSTLLMQHIFLPFPWRRYNVALPTVNRIHFIIDRGCMQSSFWYQNLIQYSVGRKDSHRSRFGKRLESRYFFSPLCKPHILDSLSEVSTRERAELSVPLCVLSFWHTSLKWHYWLVNKGLLKSKV